MSDGPPEDRIWSHYQNHDRSVFEGSVPRLEAMARLAASCLGRTGRVLTVGVGDGYLERRLAGAGWVVTVLDPDPEAVARIAEEGFVAGVGVLQSVPFEDHCFDVVVATEVLEHIDQDDGPDAVAEVARVLRPAGWFVGSVPFAEDLAVSTVVCPGCGETFHRWGHRRSFGEVQLRTELQASFAAVDVWRTAFVRFRGRGPMGWAKSCLRWWMGRRGEALASPHLAFAAQVSPANSGSARRRRRGRMPPLGARRRPSSGTGRPSASA